MHRTPSTSQGLRSRSSNTTRDRKISKISPGAYIVQRPFLMGLYSEGLIYGGKFPFQNRLGQPYSWKQTYHFFFVLLCIGGKFSKYKPRGGGGAYIWRGNLTEGFLRYRFGGLIFEGAYTRRGLFSEFYGMCQRYRKRYLLPLLL